MSLISNILYLYLFAYLKAVLLSFWKGEVNGFNQYVQRLMGDIMGFVFPQYKFNSPEKCQQIYLN